MDALSGHKIAIASFKLPRVTLAKKNHSFSSVKKVANQPEQRLQIPRPQLLKTTSMQIAAQRQNAKSAGANNKKTEEKESKHASQQKLAKNPVAVKKSVRFNTTPEKKEY